MTGHLFNNLNNLGRMAFHRAVETEHPVSFVSCCGDGIGPYSKHFQGTVHVIAKCHVRDVVSVIL